MSVRAKFQVQSVTHHYSASPDYSAASVKLHAVYGNGKENESWAKSTPSGTIEMIITNPAAVEALELGKEYFVDFTPAA